MPYYVDTPPGTPSPKENSEQTKLTTSLSPCLKRMSLKRPRENEEEETEGMKIKTQRTEKVEPP